MLSSLDVSEVFITDELERRPASPADYLREKLALQDLARQMAEHPAEVLPRLVTLAMEICEADTAGISIYEPEPDGDGVFRWKYLTGALAAFDGGVTPRHFSPCGIVVDHKRPELVERPERVYSWLVDAGVGLPECLLVPLYIGQAEPLGTLWVVAHEGQQFNGAHARVMSELAAFAGLAFKMIEAERHLTLALNQEQTLSREMSHRVKNLFAIANGLVSVSARAATTPKDMAVALSGRLAALSRAHGIVNKSFVDLARAPLGELGQLVRAVLQPYDAEGNIEMSGPAVPFGERAINAMAMVLHELATNAVKYGALKVSRGTVTVAWKQQGDTIALSWRESGGPAIAAPPTRQGFGSELARRSVEQLGGTMTYSWEPGGLVIDMSLPAERLR